MSRSAADAAKRASKSAGRALKNRAADFVDFGKDTMKAIDQGGGAGLRYNDKGGGIRLRDKAAGWGLETANFITDFMPR